MRKPLGALFHPKALPMGAWDGDDITIYGYNIRGREDKNKVGTLHFSHCKQCY